MVIVMTLSATAGALLITVLGFLVRRCVRRARGRVGKWADSEPSHATIQLSPHSTHFSDDNLESIQKRFATFVKESMPVLQYFEQLALVSKIDGTRPVDEVWADSQATIAGYERKFAPAPPRATVRVAVFALDEPHTPDVAARVAADAAKRWGDGVVAVEGAQLGVAASLKAFDLEALRAFD